MAHILAVDDEPHIRELVSVILTAEGHSVELAADGFEALCAVERRLPDLIVLDLAMPEMNGWRFLEELYVRGLRRRTRIVILSGRADEYPGEDVEGSPRHFLEKPFDAHNLVVMVADALERTPREIVALKDRRAELARLLQKMDRLM